jgi:type VI protein secretion system component VasF
MKYVLFSLSDEIILPETKRDGTKKWPHTPMKMKFRNGGQTPDLD